jgi:hypothetical protein
VTVTLADGPVAAAHPVSVARAYRFTLFNNSPHCGSGSTDEGSGHRAITLSWEPYI